MHVASDCLSYLGDRPCHHHKHDGSVCRCEYYEKIDKHILIIKLGARGDVIRSTPILRRLKKEYQNAKIYWLTDFPDCVPDIVNVILPFNVRSCAFLYGASFDLLLNLDKDPEACALARKVRAQDKRGFILDENNAVVAYDHNGFHALKVGIDDSYAKKHKRSYQSEIFELCGFTFNKEEYLLDEPPVQSKGYIGLNTGCGERWLSRLWPEAYWTKLSLDLKRKGYSVLLLGGENEDEKNKRIQHETGALYEGVVPLSEFPVYIMWCDVIVTSVTMAMHYAIGFKKQVVLFNNIFNASEFELYGRGVILEPSVSCKGCYKSYCTENCMNDITPECVFDAVLNCMPKENCVYET